MNAERPPAQTYRILVVEDVATDAELEIRELKRAGLRVEHHLVDNEEAFVRALAVFGPDVIISDFSMPHFDGMAALALAREAAPEIPFIFVSGTIGEEYAIRALKNGATDYVLKTNLVRLPAAVERAIGEASERRGRRRLEGMFREILENTADAMVVVDHRGKIVLVNGSAERMFGHSRGELAGMSLELLVPERARADHAQHRAAFMGNPRARAMGANLELAALRKDGSELPVEISLGPIPSPEGTMVVAAIRDISDRKLQERRIARLSHIREVTSAINSVIVRVRDRQKLLEEVCRITIERGGIRAARLVEFEGSSDRLRITAGTEDRRDSLIEVLESYQRDPAGSKSLLAAALRSGRAVVSNDVMADDRVLLRDWYVREDVNSVACLPFVVEDRVSGALVLYAQERGYFDDEEMHLLGELTDNLSFALELMAKQEKLDFLAYYDALTNLPNRTLFRDRLAQAIETARREQTRLGLMVLDIERFKTINDTLGLPAGDRVLQLLAQRLREVTADDNRLARLGADLFTVVFPAIREETYIARAVAATVAKFLDLPLDVGGRELRISVKAGISVFPEDGTDADSLFRNAEASLKRAKSRGERYLFYESHINARMAEQVDLEQNLRRALERGELFLHFQPKVELATRSIVGLEALLRWRGPDGKPVPPGRFVPVLEETGLILEAGRQVLAKAATAYRDWAAAGMNPPRIAVNVSSLQLRRASFVEEVVAAVGNLADCGIDIEITESLLMENIEASISKLRNLREQGLKIALDDFGTGYSSLAYLSRLPIDTVKIDRAFIHDMTGNADNTSIVSTIISLAQALRLKVVAEGVETEEQAQLLRLLRCDEMQGYLFSPPVPEEKLLAMLSARTA